MTITYTIHQEVCNGDNPNEDIIKVGLPTHEYLIIECPMSQGQTSKKYPFDVPGQQTLDNRWRLDNPSGTGEGVADS